MKTIQEIYNEQISKQSDEGLKTYLDELDSEIKSLKPKELIGIFSRPSFGKTTFAITIAVNNILNGNKKVAFFSPFNQLNVFQRFISAIYECDLTLLQSDIFTELEKELVDNLKHINFKLNTDDLSSLKQVEEKLSANEKFDLVIIDDFAYLYSIENFNNRNSYNFCKSLKDLAVKFNVPVIITGWLNRISEHRVGPKTPILADIRDFKYLENFADKLIFIHRPEFHGFTETSDGMPTNNLAELLIFKNSTGRITDVKVTVEPQYSKFINLHFFNENFRMCPV